MSKVFFIKKNFFPGLENAFNALGFEKRFSGKMVAVKLHFGEHGNLNYVRPAIASKTIGLLKKARAKPFLFDSLTSYKRKRYTVAEHLNTARLNGFSEETMDCPIVIGNEGKKAQGKIIEVEICKELAEAEAMLVVSHCKGHAFSGIGGAIKNLGMGGVSRKTKKAEHDAAQAIVDGASCIGCKACEKACPVDAIAVKNGKATVDFDSCWGCCKCLKACKQLAIKPRVALPDHLLASAAFEVLNCFNPENLLFVNVLMGISAECDCESKKAGAIMRDIGLLVSDNIASIDAASFELINKEFGRDFCESLGYRSAFQQIEWLEAQGYKRDFKIIEI